MHYSASKKRTVYVFSDPGGAKAIIALYLGNRGNNEEALLISDRYHDFYVSMVVKVKILKNTELFKVLDDFEPSLIITATSVPVGIELNCLIYARQKTRIKTFTFIDHWTNIAMRFKMGNQLILPDSICLIDEHAKIAAIKDGIPEGILAVIGNPYYEYLHNWKPKVTKNELLNALSIPKEAKYILYAPEPFSVFGLKGKYGFDEIDGLEKLMELILEAKVEDNYLIIKCHPNQNISLIELFLENHSSKIDKIKIVEHYDINDLIYYSQCVVGFFSNSLVEASILGKEVLRMLILLKDPLLDPLLNNNIGVSYFDKEEMIKRITILSIN